MTHWIAVASAARARIFEQTGPKAALEEIDDLVNPEDRLRQQDLGADRPGRTFDSAGEQRHAMEPPTGPREKRAIAFARTVVDALEAGRTSQRFAELWLIAPPRFLGRLREHMSEELAKTVTREINKDLTQESPEAIVDHIAAAGSG